ncbi:uncharacterized protein LOC134258062 [Saccostrea cucullata]|uniref:uncharacterized protein LOC134258062 n=1 Tax=Saccostrea cuccullata TaxID=36930 RepID=UPI002ED5EA11
MSSLINVHHVLMATFHLLFLICAADFQRDSSCFTFIHTNNTSPQDVEDSCFEMSKSSVNILYGEVLVLSKFPESKVSTFGLPAYDIPTSQCNMRQRKIENCIANGSKKYLETTCNTVCFDGMLTQLRTVYRNSFMFLNGCSNFLNLRLTDCRKGIYRGISEHWCFVFSAFKDVLLATIHLLFSICEADFQGNSSCFTFIHTNNTSPRDVEDSCFEMSRSNVNILYGGINLYIKNLTNDSSCSFMDLKLETMQKYIIDGTGQRRLCRTKMVFSINTTMCEKTIRHLKFSCDENRQTRKSIFFQKCGSTRCLDKNMKSEENSKDKAQGALMISELPLPNLSTFGLPAYDIPTAHCNMRQCKPVNCSANQLNNFSVTTPEHTPMQAKDIQYMLYAIGSGCGGLLVGSLVTSIVCIILNKYKKNYRNFGVVSFSKGNVQLLSETERKMSIHSKEGETVYHDISDVAGPSKVRAIQHGVSNLLTDDSSEQRYSESPKSSTSAYENGSISSQLSTKSAPTKEKESLKKRETPQIYHKLARDYKVNSGNVAIMTGKETNVIDTDNDYKNETSFEEGGQCSASMYESPVDKHHVSFLQKEEHDSSYLLESTVERLSETGDVKKTLPGVYHTLQEEGSEHLGDVTIGMESNADQDKISSNGSNSQKEYCVITAKPLEQESSSSESLSEKYCFSFIHTDEKSPDNLEETCFEMTNDRVNVFSPGISFYVMDLDDKKPASCSFEDIKLETIQKYITLEGTSQRRLCRTKMIFSINTTICEDKLTYLKFYCVGNVTRTKNLFFQNCFSVHCPGKMSENKEKQTDTEALVLSEFPAVSKSGLFAYDIPTTQCDMKQCKLENCSTDEIRKLKERILIRKTNKTEDKGCLFFTIGSGSGGLLVGILLTSVTCLLLNKCKTSSRNIGEVTFSKQKVHLLSGTERKMSIHSKEEETVYHDISDIPGPSQLRDIQQGVSNLLTDDSPEQRYSESPKSSTSAYENGSISSQLSTKSAPTKAKESLQKSEKPQVYHTLARDYKINSGNVVISTGKQTNVIDTNNDNKKEAKSFAEGEQRSVYESPVDKHRVPFLQKEEQDSSDLLDSTVERSIETDDVTKSLPGVYHTLQEEGSEHLEEVTIGMESKVDQDKRSSNGSNSQREYYVIMAKPLEQESSSFESLSEK